MQENTNNNLSINKRIAQVLDYYKHTRYKFAKETGISESVLLNIFKGSNKPGYDFIMKMLNKYEAIDARWLITGTGNMISEINSAKVLENESKQGESKTCQMCLEKDKTIKAQDDAIWALRITVDTLTSEKSENKIGFKQTG